MEPKQTSLASAVSAPPVPPAPETKPTLIERRLPLQLKLEGNFKRGVSKMIPVATPEGGEEDEALFDDWSFDEDEGTDEDDELDFWAASDDEDVFVINS